MVEPYHGGLNQQWVQDGPHIVSKVSGHVLDVWEGNKHLGTKVKMWKKTFPVTKNQTWMIEYHY